MPIFIEAFTVCLPQAAINRRYPGGWRGYCRDAPNDSLRSDGLITGISFVRLSEVVALVNKLKSHGFSRAEHNAKGDIVVLEQDQLPETFACSWCELSLSFGLNWLLAWHKDDMRRRTAIGVPQDWTVNNSLRGIVTSRAQQFLSDNLVYLRQDGDLKVYLELSSGKERLATKWCFLDEVPEYCRTTRQSPAGQTHRIAICHMKSLNPFRRSRPLCLSRIKHYERKIANKRTLNALGEVFGELMEYHPDIVVALLEKGRPFIRFDEMVKVTALLLIQATVNEDLELMTDITHLMSQVLPSYVNLSALSLFRKVKDNVIARNPSADFTLRKLP